MWEQKYDLYFKGMCIYIYTHIYYKILNMVNCIKNINILIINHLSNQIIGQWTSSTDIFI